MVLRTSVLAFAVTIPAVVFAQTQAPAAPATQGTMSPPSATLQPSLDILKQAIGSADVAHWKASSAIRDEAQSNLQSVQRDVATTLPGLLSTADAAPGSVAKTMPVFRNVDALYDVMLRIVVAAHLAAPKDQISALDQALSSLSEARRSLGDQIQSNAEAQETRELKLQTALRAVPPPAPAPAPVACTPPVKKRRTFPKKKTTATTKSTSSNSNSQTH